MDEQFDSVRGRIVALQQRLHALEVRADDPTAQREAERLRAELTRLEADLAHAPVEEPALVGAAAAGPSRLTRNINEITDPLLRRVEQSSLQDAVALSLQQVLAEAGPRQAAVLRRCAIPRWFDLDVLAQLRERPDGNARVLEIISGYSFVRQVNGGRYSYHEAVRAALLDEWRAKWPEEFQAINQQLAGYFRQRAEQLKPAPPPAPKNLPFMTMSMSPAHEWELYEREALYHLLIADPDVGMQQLRDAFDKAEAAHRLGEAEALLQLTADVPLTNAQAAWASYLQARIERAALRLDAAAVHLEALRGTVATDTLLAARVNQTLGEVYAETGRWVQAIDLYRESLQSYEAQGLTKDTALVMLRLGEAFHEIGRNTGGWHVRAYPRSRFWRSLGELWNTLLALPFFLVIGVLSLLGKRYVLPRPRYLASYQNWLLTWLYRTARRWYVRAFHTYEQSGDDEGMLHAEQRLAQILHTFGYHDEASRMLNHLLKRPSARAPYVRAWIDRDRAAVLLAQGQVDEARELLEPARRHFHEVGDVRREASVLALKSRADIRSGDAAQALDGYRTSLAKYRQLGYAAAREKILYDLRAWQRRIGDGPRWQQINDVLNDEPEKRYVARFPRSLRPLLQLLMLGSVPLALLLLAITAPRIRFQIIQSLVTEITYYDLRSALTTLTLLLVVYSLTYTLLALGVIFLLPLDTLRREQPDVIVTDPEGISRYDSRGKLATRIRWADVRQWVLGDFRLWRLPLPLFSSTFLEHRDGTDLVIDGITEWYPYLQQDIDRHLQQVDHPVACEDRGFSVLHSKMGVSLVLGVLLLLLFIATENGWVKWPLLVLPPAIYAAAAVVVFSGVLILAPLAYWFVVRPLSLRRSLNYRDAWPVIVAIGGVVAFVLGLPFEGNRLVERIPALGISLMLWGAYVFADGVATLAMLRTRARLLLLVAAVLLTALFAGPRGWLTYLSTFNQAVLRRAELLGSRSPSSLVPMVPAGAAGAVEAFGAEDVLNDTSLAPEQRAEVYSDQGNTQYVLGNYQEAVEAYDKALKLYAQDPTINTDAEMQLAAASALYNRGRALQQIGDEAGWQRALQDACRLAPTVAPECARVLQQ